MGCAVFAMLAITALTSSRRSPSWIAGCPWHNQQCESRSGVNVDALAPATPVASPVCKASSVVWLGQGVLSVALESNPGSTSPSDRRQLLDREVTVVEIRNLFVVLLAIPGRRSGQFDHVSCPGISQRLLDVQQHSSMLNTHVCGL